MSNSVVLSDRDLFKYTKKYNLVSPFIRANVQPASIDLTLGDTFLIPWRANSNAIYQPVIDLADVASTNEPSESFKGSYILRPGRFVLGTTEEWINIPDTIVASIEGKSSLARLGLFVHVTAGFVDPGFKGRITLELVNMNPMPIRLRPGNRICQIAFHQLTSAAERPYGSEGLGSKYQNQLDTTPSRYAG